MLAARLLPLARGLLLGPCAGTAGPFAAVTGWHTSSCSASSSSSSSSRAGGPVKGLDRIILTGLTFHGYHGAIPEEQVLGQKFVVDAVLFCDLSKAGRSDQLQDTVNYAEVYSTVQEVVEGRPRQLLEAVAHVICQRVLDSQPLVAGMQVAIKKPHVALTGAFDHLGIEITRWRPAE